MSQGIFFTASLSVDPDQEEAAPANRRRLSAISQDRRIQRLMSESSRGPLK